MFGSGRSIQHALFSINHDSIPFAYKVLVLRNRYHMSKIFKSNFNHSDHGNGSDHLPRRISFHAFLNLFFIRRCQIELFVYSSISKGQLPFLSFIGIVLNKSSHCVSFVSMKFCTISFFLPHRATPFDFSQIYCSLSYSITVSQSSSEPNSKYLMSYFNSNTFIDGDTRRQEFSD